MIGVNRMLGMLKAQRQELLGQLDAIDKAIAAFAGAGTPAEATGRVKSRPMQSDSHKEAIRAGKRRARAAREASKGLAREMPDDSFVPAIRARGDRQSPRLMKRPSKT